MLARYLLLSLCLSVCLSVTNWYCIETTERIELVLARRRSSAYPTLCYKEIRVSPKLGTSLWNFVPGLTKFRRGKSLASSTKLVDDGAC